MSDCGMLVSYKDETWNQRFQRLGDQAEQAFEEYASTNNISYIRWGLDRPKLNVKKLPERIRYTPDYLCEEYYVECIGLGRDQTAKLAIYKWNCLQWHNTTHPVMLFIWDSYKKRGKLVPLSDVNVLIDKGLVTLGSFPEEKAYWGLPAAELFAA